MKNNFFKVFFIVVLSVVCFYFFKDFHFTDKYDLEIKNVEPSQEQFDVAELKTKYEPVWFIKTENPVFALKIVFKNEGKRNFSQTPELLQVVLNTIFEGAGEFDEIQLKKILSENSIALSIKQNLDDIVVEMSGVTDNFAVAVDLLSDLLTKAHLKKEKIEISKQGVVSDLKQGCFSTDALAKDALLEVLYGEDHPYRETRSESLAKLPTYTKEQCDACYEAIFSAKDARITVGGDLNKEFVKEACDKLLDSLVCKKNDFNDAGVKKAFVEKMSEKHVFLKNDQTTVLFAIPFVLDNEEERFAARFANNVFGGGEFVARLLKNIRINAGLVYRMGTFVAEYDLARLIIGQTQAREENVAKIIELVKRECAIFYEKGITQEELDYFKIFIGSKKFLATTKDIIDFVSFGRNDHVGVNNINHYLNNYYNLTVEDVNKVIKKIFNPKNLIFITAGEFLKKDGGQDAKND